MCVGTRAAQALQHVNLLLVLFAGASLATAARLRYDPSTYIPLRELMEFEYRVVAGAVPAAGAAMLALSHFAVVAAAPAPSSGRPRRVLLYTYAALMMAAIVLELSLAGWVWSRVVAFMNSPQAEEMEQILATREHLQPLLEHLARWHQIPDHLRNLIKEAEEDLPWNGYIAAAGMVTLLVLQLLGVVFAVLAARTPRTRHAKAQAFSASRVSLVDSLRYTAAVQHCKLVIVWLSLDRSSLSSRGGPATPPTPASVRSVRSVGGRSDEWAPLKAKYRNGRIVPV